MELNSYREGPLEASHRGLTFFMKDLFGRGNLDLLDTNIAARPGLQLQAVLALQVKAISHADRDRNGKTGPPRNIPVRDTDRQRHWRNGVFRCMLS